MFAEALDVRVVLGPEHAQRRANRTFHIRTFEAMSDVLLSLRANCRSKLKVQFRQILSFVQNTKRVEIQVCNIISILFQLIDLLSHLTA